MAEELTEVVGIVTTTNEKEEVKVASKETLTTDGEKEQIDDMADAEAEDKTVGVKNDVAVSTVDTNGNAADVHMEEATKVIANDDDKKRRRSKSKQPEAISGNDAPPLMKRDRRERKSAITFTPDDFTLSQNKSVTVVEGRGAQLSNLPSVVESIEAASNSNEGLVATHRLIFASRGKPPKKVLKENILAFSGYLPQKDKDMDKKAQDAVDEEHEVRNFCNVWLTGPITYS